MGVLPALRTDIDLLPVRFEGRSVLLIRDPFGIAPRNTALSAEVAPYLPLFDGSSTVADLQAVMMLRNGGSLVFLADAERIVEELARLGILQTEEYCRAREGVIRKFASDPERPAALAGDSYPEDPRELASLLDRILSLPVPPADPLPGPPCGLAAPHIDLRVAERTYAAAYGALRGAAPSAILLLGTGHSMELGRFSLSAKTFTTPLGRVHADREAVSRIREAASGALSPDDFAHRREHSLEFQLLFLQRLLPMEETPILPVLCGHMEDFFGTVGSPLEDPAIASFVEALSSWLAGPPAHRTVVAGVDLSHAGPKFGDRRTGASLEPDFRAYDRQILDALEAGDASALFRAGARTRNRYRICGFSALWTLLALLPGVRGTVLDYDVWHEEPTRSAVSFAAVAFRPVTAAESPPRRPRGPEKDAHRGTEA